MDQIITIFINKLLLFRFLNIIKGAIFCQVINSKHLFHLIFAIISGIHLWNGAAPNLIRILTVIITFIVFIIKGFIDINIKKIMVNNKILLILWVKKYIIAASEFDLLMFVKITGIKDIKLISNPIHIPIQLLEDKVIIVLIIKVIKNNQVLFLIREERFLYK